MKTPIHLNALRSFEASARHGSFSGAAKELHVTPAAVGQLVRSLEEWLGAPLFHRSGRGTARLVATDVAQRALVDIRSGLNGLTLGLERLKEGSASGVLNVAVSPAFAAKWLMPRIDRFQAAWPDTDVRLDTNLKLVDYVAQNIHIGVRYGLGNWPGLTAEKLMAEEFYPVCSPALLGKRGKLRKPGDLGHENLIHDVSVDHKDFPSWAAWLKQAGVSDFDTKRGMCINSSAAVLQAAINGRGIALARSVMTRDDLAAGRVVRLFPRVKFTSSWAYYVVYRPECSALPSLVAFRDWLVSEASK
jgi:LysR family glycine cleavage system transcriptional activator